MSEHTPKGPLTRERIDQIYRDLMGDEAEDPVRWRKRMRILRAATELFLQFGYRKTSVDDIARKAEVAKGTVYLYFPNKSAILIQAVALEKRAMFDQLAPIFDGTMPSKNHLRFFLKTCLEATEHLPLVAKLLRDDKEMMAALEDADPEMMAQNMAMGEEWITSMIEAAAPNVFSDAEKSARAHVLIGARYFMTLMTHRHLLGAGRSALEVASTLVDMVMFGTVRPPPDEEDPEP
ncbi:MAG: TetR/AcrR family transcriptional regulator [Sandaracinaceae bacterium]